MKVQNRTLEPGQLNVTQETYDNVVLQQLNELWTKYGRLDEIWFDGGFVFAGALILSPMTLMFC